MNRRRLRTAVRDRFVRAVAEAVQPGNDSMRAELRAIRTELEATRADVARLIRDGEVRRTRNIRVAAQSRALAETEVFVTEQLPRVRSFARPDATRRHALSLVSVDGMALEFGVASGHMLRLAVAALPNHPVYGFDAFTGLPEDWRTGFHRGAFAQQSRPDVPGATVVEGLFEQTLPDFLAAHDGPVAYLHLDADLYSSTRTVLDLVGDRLVPGTVVLLDEYFNYPGWREGEFLAWAQFTERTGLRFRYEAFTHNNEQVALSII